MWMDIRAVKNKGGSDFRSRAMIPEGSTIELVVTFGASFGVDRITAALDAAGSLAGHCELRPERGGELGTFSFAPLGSDTKTVERIIKACSVPEEPLRIPPHMLRALDAIPHEKQTQGQRKIAALGEHLDSQGRLVQPKGKRATNGAAHAS
jgi:hypothetical protein